MNFGRGRRGWAPHFVRAAPRSRSVLLLVATVALAAAVLVGVTRDGRRATVSDGVAMVQPLPVAALAATIEAPPETAPPAPVPATPPTTAPAPVATPRWSCSEALAYLAANQAPGFVGSCGPGSALGHYGFTCWNVAVHCPDGARIIHIACPAPFVYMNEAHNSWTLTGARDGIDPYGQGSASEQAFCDGYR